MSKPQTSTWSSSGGYIWSMLGSAIGFANLLGFGSQAYKNGGGAFLIPFFTALIVLGIPMLFLEGIMGQKHAEPLVTCYGRVIGRPGKIFGWLAVIAVTTIGAFYTVLTGWSIAYTYYAGAGLIPEDVASFFYNDFLHATGKIFIPGTMSIPVLVSTLFVGVLGWIVLSRNIQKGIEKWCSFFLPLLAVVILIFAAAVFFLPGSEIGFYRYLYPDFSKLKELTIWRDVFGQLFFSLSLGLGIVVGYSRHTTTATDIRKAMIIVAFSDFLISFISGFIIFGCLGYMSYLKGVPFDSIADTNSIFDIGYLAFPLILMTFGPVFSKILGAIFFFCLFIAGFTGIFSIVESIVGNLRIEFQMSRKRAVTISMGMILLLALPFSMGNGTALIDAIEPMVMGNNMLIGGIAQIIVFMYLSKEISANPIWYKGKKRHLAFYSIKYLSLVILIVSLVISLSTEYTSGFGIPEAVRWSWFVAALAIATALAYKDKEVGQGP